MKATTSQKLSWIQTVTSGQAETESAIVYRAIKQHGPCSYHKIMDVTGLPINHCVRAINSLTSDRYGIALAEVAFLGKESKTNRTVQYYRVRQMQLTLAL
jgi:hypothetical protein